MFKKKPNIKSLSPIKNSERRKLADQIIADFGLEHLLPPADTDPDSDDAIAKAGLTSLRNALLPDRSQAARFTTTIGPDAKEVSGTVYVGAPPDNKDLRVLWVRMDDKIYPTVYTLWRNPGIVPLLHTPGFVVNKIQAGADLMTPGLQNGPPFPQKATQGAIVAVADLDSPSVPIAVGVCEIDVSALQEIHNARGHAVRSVHWAGDEIWSWSISGKGGMAPPVHLDGWYVGAGEASTVSDGLSFSSLQGTQDGGVRLDSQELGGSRGGASAVQAEDSENVEVEDVELTTKDIDQAFKLAFVYGVHHHMRANKHEHDYGLAFPLSQSFVMANLIQPFLPAFTPRQAASLQIKKTSFKSIRKFVKYLHKTQFVKSKDRDGNEVVIIDIDFSHENLDLFTPYRLPQKGTAAHDAASPGIAAACEADVSIGQKLTRTEHFRPKHRLEPLFVAANANPRGMYTTKEVRQVVMAYIESEKLAVPTNKRIVTLNPILVNAIYDVSAHEDMKPLAKDVTRDALVDRVLAACDPFQAIVRDNETAAPMKTRACLVPKVGVTLEKRSGNKTVTKTSGLEAYFVNPQALADELRKACASSTSVELKVGCSPKNPLMEVMVQGPHKDAVLRALEKRGIMKAWVEVTDKTKRKK